MSQNPHFPTTLVSAKRPIGDSALTLELKSIRMHTTSVSGVVIINPRD